MRSSFLTVITLLLCLLPLSAAGENFQNLFTGTLSGLIQTPEGLPIVNGSVAFFNRDSAPPPVVSGTRRIPDMIAPTDDTGHFEVQLITGWYFIGSMPRSEGRRLGPPQLGDSVYFAVHEANQLQAFEVLPDDNCDLGIIRMQNVSFQQASPEFFQVTGTVINEQGAPFAGALVLAKRTPQQNRPDFIAEPTDSNGRYTLELPANEIFFILARESFAVGRPADGQHLGSYGGEEPIPVRGVPGEHVGGIDITAGKLPERGKPPEVPSSPGPEEVPVK